MAALTSFLGEQQYELLRFLADMIVIVFDKDKAGDVGRYEYDRKEVRVTKDSGYFNISLVGRKNITAVDVEGCARCGKNHRKMTFVPFKIPMSVGKVVFTHWSMCPRRHEPVVMRV